MRLLLVTLLLTPVCGMAQTLVLTVSGNPVALNASGCGNNVAGAWTGTNLTAACNAMQIWATASTTCGSAPSTTNSPPDVVVQTVQARDLQNGTTCGTYSFAFNTLPSFTSNACGANVDFTNYLCASVTSRSGTGSCDGTVAQASSLSIRYDNISPPPPLLSVTPLDSKLSVGITATGSSTDISDVQFFNVEFTVNPTDGGTPTWIGVGGNISANSGSLTINNLTNGTVYLVRGYSIDEASNISAPSTPVEGEPVVTYGFYANYVDDGGQDTGGCTAAGGALSGLSVAAVAILALVRRRG